MSPNMRAVLDVLVAGRADGTITKEHPIKGLDLLKKAKVPFKREQSAGGKMRYFVNTLRNDYRWPIGSTSGTAAGTDDVDGYWMAGHRDELIDTVDNLRQRISGQTKTIHSLLTNDYEGVYR